MYCVINGPNGALIVNDVEGYDPSQVVFLSWNSEGNDDLSIAACEAVAGFINAHARHGLYDRDWGRYRLVDGGLYPAGNDPRRGISYVYQYVDTDSTYYVGKGVKDRWRQHFNGVLTEELDASETAKQERIRSAKTKNPGIQPQDLCHVIAEFTDAHRDIRAFALENYLITGHYGVMALTNLNSGKFRSDHVRWRVRPADFFAPTRHGDNLAWWSAHVQSANDWFPRTVGEMQIIEAELFVRTLPTSFADEFRNTLIQHTQHDASVFEWLGEGMIVSPEGDITIEANLRDSPIRLQFKFSVKTLSCCINVRPRQNIGGRDVQGYCDLLRMKYRGPGIRNNPGHPFLKPFSYMQNGRKDVYFPAAPDQMLTTMPVNTNCLELGLGRPESIEDISLVCATDRLIRRFIS